MAAAYPIHLGLALYYSVFMFEVLSYPGEARMIARTAFEDAVTVLDFVAEESFPDYALIMQLVRCNLTLCSAGSC